MKKIITILVMLTSMQSQGVHLSEDGTGQVLIFPYYTVNAGFNSLLTITNTTQRAKALRVRFREAANSREVFTFNLYLGAHDVWTAGLTKADGTDVKLVTHDNSCTVPDLHSQTNLFSKSHFTGAMQDAYRDDNNRLFEGFVEVIEMGELTGNSELAATFVELGIQPPYNCNDLVNAWDANHADNYWIQDANTDLLPPHGGISGDLTLINVPQGIAMSANPTVIENFSYEILHHNIGSDSPSLAEGMKDSTIKNDSIGFTVDASWDSGIQALSAILMKQVNMNEYEVNASFGAETTWLFTLPTRQYFTDPLYSIGSTPQMPFKNRANTPDIPNSSCLAFGFRGLNREGEIIPTPPGQVPTIPTPPSIQEAKPYLCNTSNTISINYDLYDTNTTSGLFAGNFPMKSYYGSQHHQGAYTPYHAGFFQSYFFGLMNNSDNTLTVSGLPVIAFSAQKYQNGLLADNTLANYGTISQHRSEIFVQVSQSEQNFNEKIGMTLTKDSLGQVLIYPYYTVKNGFNSLLTVVNSSDEVVAMRVRFREGKNARDVLNFNLYLAPYDVWTAQLTAVESSIEGHEQEPSVLLQTQDKSCLVPSDISLISGKEFSPDGYENHYDGKGHSLERVQEGFIEIIEMASLLGESAEFASHINGVPISCEGIEQNWQEGGKWAIDPSKDTNRPNGDAQIRGSLQLLNVTDGIAMPSSAVAISYFNTQNLHTSPGSETPNLASGNNSTTIIEYSGEVLETTWNSPLDAVSALFMHDTTSNAYDINTFAAGHTDWITMSPTQHFYTDTVYNENNPSRPYANGLATDEGYCQKFGFIAYDREQKSHFLSGPPPSPLPPGNYDEKHCNSINLSYTDVFDATENQRLDSIFGSNLLIEDWITFEGPRSMYQQTQRDGYFKKVFNAEFFNENSYLDGTGSNGESHRIYGKPIIGFTAQKYVNGKLAGGVLANYSVIKEDSTTRRIDIAIPGQ